MKKVLVLGTGSAQRDIIEYCKDNGYYVVATSNVAGYSAQELADEFSQTDITDIEATKKLAVEKSIDLVYSVGSDVAMPTIAKVSKDLGLPCFVDHETALICNHKNALRKTLNDRNVEGNIPFQSIESPDEEITVPFPAMMKPSDSQGQRGVRKVDSIEEIKAHFDETVSFSREKKVILESYIEGDEISVNAFLQDGELKFYLISDRKVWEEYPGGLIREHIIPSKYENDAGVASKIRKLVTDVLAAIGLKNGPVYFQIKVNPNGQPYIIEVTPRLDGCHMWRVIRYSTGVDLLKASMDLLEGKGYSQKESFDIIPYSLEFLCGKPGSIFDKSNYDVPDHEFLRWYYEDGRKINRMNGYFEKCGYVIKRNG